jgi:flagellar FliJ protein
MANLKPLIKLRKFRVEEMQKSLAELYREAEAIETRKQTYLTTLEHERAHIDRSQDITEISLFHTFAERVKKIVEDLNDELYIINGRIDVAREEMREAFGELKKIEMVQEQREQDERDEADKKESDTLDEIGVQRSFRDGGGDDRLV